MSWDVMLYPLSEDLRSVDDLPADARLPPIGPLATVHEGLRAAEPGIDLNDPVWGVLTGEGRSIEVDIGHHDPVEAIMLHVRGGGDDALAAIFRLGRGIGCRPVDLSEGDLLREGDPAAWHEFQSYRDQVFHDHP
ncbi:hypothetical protein [Saccharothrix longispora]|uniref:hypothetical protein n=1 Tax=Saccharothrix longispora TaxID=33920 RepID=UPI0028FD5766|nr:hypothetical protein [Saccharothrix longispora]MDU0290883.1 hypothetical protein [Saccharothrix longispora]